MDAATLRRRLAAAFGEVDAATMRLVRAPGRVNLIGEHTDYNDGFVLPAAIDLEVWIGYVPTDDGRVELELEDGSRGGFELDRPEEAAAGWIRRLAGMAWALKEQQVSLHGLRAVLFSEIPPGAGLSSSAAVEVAMAWALTGDRPPMEPMAVARAAQRSENDFVGVRSGIMDPFASAFGRRDSALLLDCRSFEHHPIPLPVERYAIVACDTRAPHRLEASEYNARREQCEAAAAAVARMHPEVRSLRDVTASMLADAEMAPLIRRRAEHVIEENKRVELAVEALEAGEMFALGRLFAESHASLRDLYEVSSPDLDALVEIASATPGVVATRMTGAGFGGCTVNIVERGAVESLRSAILRQYPSRTGRDAAVYAVEAVDGACEVEA
ncbi:MAG: galactokinase [Chloroflexota bacterium]|nr:galactokinase [Chloroflexota bacterium]